MEPERASTRTVSILGHPVAGLAPITFLSAGWIILIVQVIPVLREHAARVGLEDAWPILFEFLPQTPRIAMLAIAAIAMLLVGLVLFLVWIRSAGGLGPLTDRMFRRVEVLAAVILVAAGVLSIAVITRGEPVLGDAKSHIARGWLWQEYIRAGAFPVWTDLWFGGFPGSQHDPPLAHLLQGLIGFLRFDALAAAKVLVWFCRMAGAAGFALFCARIHRDHRSGLLGGILYTLAPAHHAIWVIEGLLPNALFLGILPWALLVAERLATGAGGYRSGARLALGIGLLTMAHIGQARLAIVMIAVLILVRAVPTIATRGARAPSIAGFLIGALGGAALAAAFVVPFVQDARLLNYAVPADPTGFAYRFPDIARIGETLRWTAGARPYLGLSVMILAVGGILRTLIDRGEGMRGIGPIPIAVMVLLPWFLVPVSPASAGLVFLGAQLAAAGFVRRSEASRFRWIPRRGLLPIALILILVDLAPIHLVTAYGEPHEGRDQVYAMLQDRLGGGRFLELPADRWGKVTASLAGYAPTGTVPSVGGPSIAATPRAFSYQSAVVDTVAHVLSAGEPLASGLVDLLAFHNIRAVLLMSPSGVVRPPDRSAAGLSVDEVIPVLRIEPAASVAILDQGIPPAPEPVAALVSESGLPSDVSRTLVREQIEWIRAARPRLVREARAVALPNRLEIEVPDLGRVLVRLARNAYPTTEVSVDGRPWIWEPGPLGGISLLLDEGAHKIEIWGREAPLRRGLRIAQWVLAGLLFLVAIGPPRR